MDRVDPDLLDSIRETTAHCPSAELTTRQLEDLDLFGKCRIGHLVRRQIPVPYTNEEHARPDFRELKKYDGLRTKAEFFRHLAAFINPDGEILRHIHVLEDSFLPDPENDSLEIRFKPGGPLADPASLFDTEEKERRGHPLARPEPRKKGSGSLKGLRIAVDPGHFGGKYSRFEYRHISWPDNPSGEEIVVREGELTMRTALELKKKLEQKGALVHLTRSWSHPGHPYNPGYFRAYGERLAKLVLSNENFDRILAELDGEIVRKFSNALRLYAIRKQFIFESHRTRMKRAAKFAPDFMFSIHYNLARIPTGTRRDHYLMAMVKGSVPEHRLYNPYWRFRVLRDAFETDEFGASVALARLSLRSMSGLFRMPALEENLISDQIPVLDSRGRETGVSAWNGMLFRYVDWPAALLEGTFMNEHEMDKLAKTPLHTPGTRTELYAEALSRAATEFAKILPDT